MIDQFGGETSWDITDPNGNVVLADDGPYDGYGEYTLNYCLPPQCNYTFTIYDSYGDGICCSWGGGGYLVTYDGDEVASGGTFGNQESTNFGCVVVSDCVDSPTNLSITGGTKGCTGIGQNL